jgi:2-hydroxychromene-2-carboxylate isomerase
MTRPALQFWFEFASTYSHIAAQRIEALAAAAGVQIAWRPFLLGPIFKAQGWDNSPFNLYPAKGAYMWRDMERECERFAIAFRRPSVFPRNGLIAARVAAAAEAQAWLPAFVREVYLANFAEDREIGDPAVVAEILRRSGCPDPQAAMAEANTDAVKQRLRAHTEQAIALGIFGAPSFVVGDELFWGSDRMEAALTWAMKGSDGL